MLRQIKRPVPVILLLLLSANSAFAAEPGYFPIDKLGAQGISEFEQGWYSPILKKMDEPSLMTLKDTRSQLFRFIYLPTWGNPISVRLSIIDGIGIIEGRRLDGQAGYDPGKLVERTFVTLNKAEIDQAISLYAKLKFFNLKTADKLKGCDGSQWILEVADRGTYHVVVRWTPTEYDPGKRQTADFVNICKWLYKKSGFRSNGKNKGYTEIEIQ